MQAIKLRADRWQTFRRRYTAELEDHIDEIERLRSLCQNETVTLVYSARDEAHNNAVVLKELLSRKQS